MDPPIADWPRSLKQRRGGRTLLDGIEIWYDFDWRGLLGHDRGVFPNCKSIGRKIRQLTPVDVTPVLLLTQEPGDSAYRVAQGADGRLVHILNIQSVRNVSADAADTLVGHQAVPDTDIKAALDKLRATPTAIRGLIAEHLDAKGVLSWMLDDDEHLKDLTRELTVLDLEHLARVVATAFSILARVGSSPEVLQDFSSEATSDLLRLAAAGASYAQQSAAVEELTALLVDDHDEQTYQSFFQGNSWMFGARFVGRWPGRQITLGDQQDFILRTSDGFFDLIELKRPSHQVLRWDESHESYFPSRTLSMAIGQVLKYLLDIDNDLHRIRSEFGLDVHRARAVIVIGRADAEDPRFAPALRNLNAHMNRIEVWTYTQILAMAHTILGHTEATLEGQGS